MKNLKIIFIIAMLFLTGKLIAAPPATPVGILGDELICNGTSATLTIVPGSAADGYYWVVTGASWSFSSSTTSDITNSLTAGPSNGTVKIWAFNSEGNSGTFTKVYNQLGSIGSITTPVGFHCTGESKTYTVNPVTAADTYHWSISGNGWSVSNSTATWTQVTGGTGNAILSVFASNDCDSTTTSTTTIIPKIAPVSISAIVSGPHCSGTSNTYTVAPVPGAVSYSWYLESTDAGWSAVSSTTTEFVVSSATYTTGSATILAAANNVCGSSATISRVIDPLGAPTGLVASPVGEHCINTSKTYTVIPVEHATSYSWWFSGGTGWSATSNTMGYIVVTSGTMTAGDATIKVAANNDCGTSGTFTATIQTYYAPSTPTAINHAPLHCSGTSATYSVNPVNQADYYVWSVNNPTWSALGTSNLINITAGTGSCTISVSAVNDCAVSAPRTLVVTPAYIPVLPVITKPVFHCSGAIANYSAVSDINATNYTWYIKGTGWSGTGTGRTIALTAGTSSATISTVAHGPCGSSSTYTTTMSPSFIPQTPDRIYTPPFHCEGEIKTYACSPIAGATSYYWLITGTGWTGNSTTNYIDLRAGQTPAIIQVQAVTPCGMSGITMITVTPDKTPAPPSAIQKPTRHCIGTTMTYSVKPVPGASSYIWILTNKPNAVTPWTKVNSTGQDIDLTAGSDSATIVVFANNRCGTGSSYSMVLVPNKAPAQPSVITPPAKHCEGSAQEYSISSIPGADTYLWSVSGQGWSADPSNTTECDFIAGSGVGVISVRGINGCGQGVVRTLTVMPDTLPEAPGTITKPNIHCKGTVESYSISPVPGATAYEWKISGTNWLSVPSSGTTINVTAGDGDGEISVSALNSCGKGPEVKVTSTAIPIPTSEFGIDRDTICRDETATITYTGNAGTNATYQWNFDGGISQPGTGKGPHQVLWYDNPGVRTVRLVVTENGCPSQERLVSIFVDNCLGVEDDGKGFVNAEILPNPSQGHVILKLNNSPSTAVDLQILNSLGQKVYNEKLENISSVYSKDLNLTGLESGSYYVKLKFNDLEVVKKIIIVK